MFTMNDLSVGMFAVALMVLIPVGIYEYRTFEKKNPGDPMNKMILLAIPMILMIFFKKYIDEVSANTNFSWIVGILALASGVLFFLGLAISWTLSYKRGYIDKNRVKQVMPVVKTCALIVALCAIAIIVIKLF